MSTDLNDLSSAFRPLAEQLVAAANEQGLAVSVVATVLAVEGAANSHAGSQSHLARHFRGGAGPDMDKADAIDLTPPLDATDADWEKLAAIGRSLGLTCGADWNQPVKGHFELPPSGYRDLEAEGARQPANLDNAGRDLGGDAD